jgi:DNA-binding GntR family transcriptional regulator
LNDTELAEALGVSRTPVREALQLLSVQGFVKTRPGVIENPYITSAISTLQAHVRRLFFHKSFILTPRSVEEHEKILKAFKCRDKETAAATAKIN